MKRLLAIAAVHLLAACTTPEQRERDRLTDQIEARVKLPKGAGRLADYARHYAIDEKGLIVGVYSRGFRWPDPDHACEELLEDFSTRMVPCPFDSDVDHLRAGQRGWVDHPDRLPSIMDGGCGVVTVVYDPKASKVRDTYCNGHA